MKKNKQINPLEQHFEKLVLGAVCVLIAMATLYVSTRDRGPVPQPVEPDRPVAELIKP